MASDQGFADYVLEQAEGAGGLRVRRMFGEYVLYCDDKVVALICDNRVFVKPTVAGRAWAGDVPEAPAYPGARPSLAIDARLDDRAWFAELLRITAAELPEPAPRRKRAGRG
ncbi:MAG: competence protein TfoX [Candidatus Dactylopiibacterium carminicum]|uniref:Competence protein TfoX n=1 Tax=Candidatus Dactylopiibacterium carminicum TaxID=857335 RepID=A0A272ES65_9RHOO|nr:TfoX/Sxy family protein [Candidatus Dactylopiibacterium carminicum]KAF7598987.1 competence protein TfoX [Candidatus Dactylopiibacterium carminicum]PAS92945.1 MAG: competence protein TfoX [Candidatus Dactylopiibacterium carminicum]PAS96596.1 MAG: competence protein TfoX [Candidatus Dactylopiibacterium carminicum]PAS98999.1 MAG: competence protein TfoX [Candidatus Dactylopiibacterium carminicum]